MQSLQPSGHFLTSTAIPQRFAVRAGAITGATGEIFRAEGVPVFAEMILARGGQATPMVERPAIIRNSLRVGAITGPPRG